MLGLMIARADGAVDTLDQLTHPFANFAFCICPRIDMEFLFVVIFVFVFRLVCLFIFVFGFIFGFASKKR